MKNLRSANAPMLALGLLSIAACSTQQVGPDNVVIGESQPGGGQGELRLAYAPSAASYQEQQTLITQPSWNPPNYNVTMDGRVLAEEEGVAGSSVAQLLPISIAEYQMAGIGNLDTGLHHFAVLVPGRPPSSRETASSRRAVGFTCICSAPPTPRRAASSSPRTPLRRATSTSPSST